MTDGIIQKVIDKNTKIYLKNTAMSPQELIKNIRQELIEKIKQEIIISQAYDECEDCYNSGVNTLIRKLIGDSKE